MAAINYDSTFLMFVEREKSIIPVAGSAFKVADGKGLGATRKLNNSYKDVLIVSREGYGWTIQKIDVVGLWGKTWLSKFLSVFTGTIKIKIHFGESIPMNLNEFKDLVIRYMGYDQKMGDPYLPQEKPLEKVFQNVRQATSFSEIFDYINVPEAQDCLDVL